MPLDKHSIDTLREKQVKSIKWQFLDIGSIHSVFFSPQRDVPIVDEKGKSHDYQGPWVQRELDKSIQMASIEREKNLFKAINRDCPVRADKRNVYVPYLGKDDGWQTASDEECALKTLEIFEQTGRILMDAMVEGNILARKGEVRCVDVDYALRPHSPSNAYLTQSIQVREKSWPGALRGYHLLKEKWLERDYPLTFRVIKGLIDLIELYEDERVDECLLTLDMMSALDKKRDAKEKIDWAYISEKIIEMRDADNDSEESFTMI
jgi:hypothetical protein